MLLKLTKTMTKKTEYETIPPSAVLLKLSADQENLTGVLYFNRPRTATNRSSHESD